LDLGKKKKKKEEHGSSVGKTGGEELGTQAVKKKSAKSRGKNH